MKQGDMPEFEPQELVRQAFFRLQQRGFKLGMAEYLAALRSIEGEFAATPEALQETLQMLWCHSRSQQSQFEPIWQSLLSHRPVTERAPKSDPTPQTQAPKPDPLEPSEPLPPQPPPAIAAEVKQREPELAALPVRAPFVPVEGEEYSTVQAYYPISRRSMVYNWRYLRRLVADGPANVLDLPATVEQVARQGFFLAPTYRRGERNQARLLLGVDQNGSMMPFHRFSRDLVETALYESGLPPEQVNVFYFQNVPAEQVYRDIYLTDSIALETFLAEHCDQETSVLIISDAGAARGYRKLDRIRATTDFLFQLKRRSSWIAWLNPMPTDRWQGSSAEIIAGLVKMEQMDNDGLSNAIDILRGQSPEPAPQRRREAEITQRGKEIEGE